MELPTFEGTPGNYTELFVTATETTTQFRPVEIVDLEGQKVIKVVEPIGSEPRLYWMPLDSFKGKWNLIKNTKKSDMIREHCRKSY